MGSALSPRSIGTTAAGSPALVAGAAQTRPRELLVVRGLEREPVADAGGQLVGPGDDVEQQREVVDDPPGVRSRSHGLRATPWIAVAVLPRRATEILSHLLSAAELTFESERALEVALHLYRDGSADFADCLHIALAAQARELPLWTFDKRAGKISGAQTIGR